MRSHGAARVGAAVGGGRLADRSSCSLARRLRLTAQRCNETTAATTACAALRDHQPLNKVDAHEHGAPGQPPRPPRFTGRGLPVVLDSHRPQVQDLHVSPCLGDRCWSSAQCAGHSASIGPATQTVPATPPTARDLQKAPELARIAESRIGESGVGDGILGSLDSRLALVERPPCIDEARVRQTFTTREARQRRR